MQVEREHVVEEESKVSPGTKVKRRGEKASSEQVKAGSAKGTNDLRNWFMKEGK